MNEEHNSLDWYFDTIDMKLNHVLQQLSSKDVNLERVQNNLWWARETAKEGRKALKVLEEGLDRVGSLVSKDRKAG